MFQILPVPSLTYWTKILKEISHIAQTFFVSCTHTLFLQVNTLRLLQVYEGYADDPRNTDNAWLETVAYSYHDNTGEHLSNLNLMVTRSLLFIPRQSEYAEKSSLFSLDI